MSDLEAIRSELARPVSRETVDKLVEALRRLLERDECDDYYHDNCLCKQDPERAARAALSAYESETKR